METDQRSGSDNGAGNGETGSLILAPLNSWALVSIQYSSESLANTSLSDISLSEVSTSRLYGELLLSPFH